MGLTSEQDRSIGSWVNGVRKQIFTAWRQHNSGNMKNSLKVQLVFFYAFLPTLARTSCKWKSSHMRLTLGRVDITLPLEILLQDANHQRQSVNICSF